MLGLDHSAAGAGDSYAEHSSIVQAVVDMYGPTDLGYLRANPALRWYPHLLFGRRFGDEDIRRASPLHYVTSAAPPFLIIHGELDMIVPSRQSRALYEQLSVAGAAAELVMVKYANHALIPMGRFIQPGRDELCNRIVEFFVDYLARE
jgi:dipeptidyl aminopeptidase/acylaminoacyl peptidase